MTRIVLSPTVEQQAQRIILTVQELDDVETAIKSLAQLFYAAFDVDALKAAAEEGRARQSH